MWRSRWGAWAARCALATCVSTAALGVPSGEALAQQPTAAQRDEAKRRFQSGLDLFKEGNYQASLVEFKRAYEIAPNYNVLYNIGQVYFQLQDYVNASKYLNQYLDEGKARIPPSRRQEVEADLEKLKARIAQVTITTNVSGAQITVDDQPIGATPLGQPALVSAGRRVFTASKEGRQTVRKTVEVAGGDRLEVSLELPELAPGQAPTPLPPVQPDGSEPAPQPQPTGGGGPAAPPPEKPFPVAPVVAWSVTGVLGIGAAVFGVMALGKDDDLATLKATPNPNEEELSSAASTTTTLAAVSDVFLVCTVIGAGISVYLTVDHVTSDPPESASRTRPPAPTVAAKVGPGSLGLAGTF